MAGKKNHQNNPNIRFGPIGLGGVDESITNLEIFHKLGLKACEIAFTYDTYIKKEEDMKKIRKCAERLDIKLSIHGSYYINLNSREKAKIEASKKRILKACEVGEKLGAYMVVFHAGYYCGRSLEESYNNIRDGILEIQNEIKKRKYKIKIGVETLGKTNIFGSLDEVSRLVKDTGCSFVLDFAHILARDKKIDFDKVKKLFPEKSWHCHFTGIEYDTKGERRHLKTEPKYWKWLIKNLPKDRKIVIINESPFCVEDAVLGLSLS